MDYLQFIDLSSLPEIVEKEILALNKEIGKRAIEIFKPDKYEPDIQLTINIDVDKCNHPEIGEKIKAILNKNRITYLISSVG